MKRAISFVIVLLGAPLVAVYFGFLAKLIMLSFNIGWGIL
jgi:hypothetical protein